MILRNGACGDGKELKQALIGPSIALFLGYRCRRSISGAAGGRTKPPIPSSLCWRAEPRWSSGEPALVPDAVRDAGIADFHWHDLHHDFASRLVKAGVNLRTVQILMGHKSIQTTCRYAHLAPKDLLDAVEKLTMSRIRRKTATDTRTSPKQKCVLPRPVAMSRKSFAFC